MRHFTRADARQFAVYFVCGVAANAVDIVGYWALVWLGMWFIYATYVSGTAAFFAAFFLQKHVVFGAKNNAMKHFVRYSILSAFNIAAVSLILYVCVAWLGLDQYSSKIIANGSQVLWNFLIMRAFVYV